MVNGVPIESQHEPLIITTEIPKLDGDSFNSMVGGCKYKDLIYRIAKDMRKFYLSFRTDKTTSCRYEIYVFHSFCCYFYFKLNAKSELLLWKIVLLRS